MWHMQNGPVAQTKFASASDGVICAGKGRAGVGESAWEEAFDL